ncbi:hypothetical protein [Roseicella aquatilis]|uniref:DUF5615 domain-containing protein n=1 Tax=Roseicella aquatilis TaxID=2527868 RepID=A0A4V2WL45_9PROT|nr:hypothetical protein [Roseicella aquatilis]TCZ61154.1 hypothetical protein EXY23_13580 [Roseicella aquatilis]
MPRVLLDENVPRGVLAAFPAGEATSVDLLGWKAIRNGELLRRAEAEGFAVLVTADRGIHRQNRMDRRGLALVVLPGNSWPRLRGRLAEIVAAAASAGPGTVVELDRAGD